MHIKQYTCKKRTEKNKTTVNLVKLKPNRKPLFFKTELKSFFWQPHTPINKQKTQHTVYVLSA